MLPGPCRIVPFLQVCFRSSSSQAGLSCLEQTPHSLLCTQKCPFRPFTFEVWSFVPALDSPGVYSRVKHLSQSEKCSSLSSQFSLVLTTNHSKSFQWTKTAENWHNSRKSFFCLFGWLVCFCFFSKFSLLIQPRRSGHLNGYMDWLWGGNASPYHKSTPSRNSPAGGWLMNVCPSLSIRASLPPLMAPWGAQPCPKHSSQDMPY